MLCPLCKEHALQPITLELGVPAHQCQRCQGIWIASNEYLLWLRTQPAPLPEKAPPDLAMPTWETQALKLCPNCGHIISRYQVLPNVKFYLDRCGHCNGVWFDPHEWDVVVARNLHDKVNQFFTQPWQAKIRAEEAHQMLDQLYLEKFGAADYARIREVWDWLRPHPQRAMLLAYLQADTPYRF